MQKPKVHMMRILSEDEDVSLCGLWFVASPTLDPREVTCRRCQAKVLTLA